MARLRTKSKNRSKPKPTKGVLKRGRITAGGKLRFSRQGKQKLNGHERGETLQDRRGYVLVGSHAAKMVSRQLKQKVTPAGTGPAQTPSQKSGGDGVHTR